MGLIILMSVCAAYALVDILSVAQRLNKLAIWLYPKFLCTGNKLFNRKPLNCQTCLSGWLALILLIKDGYALLYIPFLMCVAMVGSVVLNQIIYKVL